MTYVWQLPLWPHLRWNEQKIAVSLAEARRAQQSFLAESQFLRLQDQGELLVEEALTTSAIEGERLDPDALRSSVAMRLGLPTAGLAKVKRTSDGLVEILIDATTRYQESLTAHRLFAWQAALFPSGYAGIRAIKVGGWRESREPMQVISGPMGKQKVHFEAPVSAQMDFEMTRFLDWWNAPPASLDGLLRAGMAHFWFVTVHPFEDGNGRIARAITDMALAQDESRGKRLYSLSTQILKDKSQYYRLLEETQKGEGDLTQWLEWFLQLLVKSIDQSRTLIQKSIMIGKFYSYTAEVALNERQKKVIKKMLEALPGDFEGGLTNKKYISMTKASPETAKRDIKDILDKEILVRNPGGGRSTSYRLNRDFIDS